MSKFESLKNKASKMLRKAALAAVKAGRRLADSAKRTASSAVAFVKSTDKKQRERFFKSFASVTICAGVMIYIFTLNFAFAVSVDGEFVGYAGSVDEISLAVDNVTQTASAVLGYDYALESEVNYQFTIAKADDGIAETMETRLLDSIADIGEYAIICIDGVPFCAFETTADAAAALSGYTALYTDENTESAHFTQAVSIVVDYADSSLLETAKGFNKNAESVLSVETSGTVHDEIAVPFETEYIEDDSLFVDEQVVDQKGIDGKIITVSEMNCVNGEVVSSKILESEAGSAPVTEIIRVGTREHLSTGSYIWPTDGLLTSSYGSRSIPVGSSNHKGLDIAADYGTDIWASDGGIVICAETQSGFGKIIKIEHDNGDITYYAHCCELLKSVGDKVEQGEVIAHMGATGVATGVHVHFEYHPEGGSAVNPLTILP